MVRERVSEKHCRNAMASTMRNSLRMEWAWWSIKIMRLSGIMQKSEFVAVVLYLEICIGSGEGTALRGFDGNVSLSQAVAQHTHQELVLFQLYERLMQRGRQALNVASREILFTHRAGV